MSTSSSASSPYDTIASSFLSTSIGLASASSSAAGILGAARVQLGICPIWPVEMQVATSYTSEDLAPTMSRVLQLYKESLPHDPQEAMGSMMDVVVHNLEHGEKFAEGSREMLTPSPTGPLENGWMSMCD